MVTVVFCRDTDPCRDEVVTQRHSDIVLFGGIPDGGVVQDKDAAVLVDDLDGLVEVLQITRFAERLELFFGFVS